MAKILWIQEPNFSVAQKSMLAAFTKNSAVRQVDIFFLTLRDRIKDSVEIKGKGGRRRKVYNRGCLVTFHKVFQEYLEKVKPEVIVVADPIILSFLMNEEIASNMLYRGSVYRYKDYPVFPFDWSSNNGSPKVRAVKEHGWILKQDINKISRWLEGKQRYQPKFNYTVCNTLEDLNEAAKFFETCFLIADDIETVGTKISCSGFCGIANDGRIHSYVIPFINPLKLGACHWDTELEEIEAWKTVRRIHETSAYKVFQNGSYDNAYYVRYRTPSNNFLFDTFHMINSIWTEAPKKLWFISSILLDFCRYWKDEAKGDAEDKRKKDKIPTSEKGYASYLKYNAQDVYNTAMNCLYTAIIMMQPGNEWTVENYRQEFRQQFGPAFAMTMRGMCHRKDRQREKIKKWETEAARALRDIKIAVDEPRFNPNSSEQVASLIYDVLGAPPVKLRGKSSKLNARTTDEKILRIIASRHPVYSIFIDMIWAAKKPRNNISKYGGQLGLHDRFMYSMSCRLETFRYRSGNHPFWVGTNAQNVPKSVRDMFVADPGYVLFEADYSQSDLYFIAFQCQDPRLIEVILDERDTHCVHAAYFFKTDYEKVLAAHKRDDDWTDHPTEGIRQNTKRITHGASFQMAEFTLFVVMGRESAVATCRALGFHGAEDFPDNEIVKILGTLLSNYYARYAKLKLWQQESIVAAVKNGNRVDNGFGRTRFFFGDLIADKGIQREISAYYGQSGTAGNVNRTLDEIYWNSGLEKQGLMLLMQDHDSIIWQVPENRLDLSQKVLDIMEKPVTINGRTFTIPVDCKVGRSWGKAMMNYRPGITTLEEIDRHEGQWQSKEYSEI